MFVLMLQNFPSVAAEELFDFLPVCADAALEKSRLSAASSLKRLGSLDKNYTVHPGHGMNTTLAFEKVYNPYMR